MTTAPPPSGKRLRFSSTLRGRIVVASIVSGLFIVATLATSSYRGNQALTGYLAASQLASDKTMLTKIIEVQVDILQERLSHIVSPPVVEALRDGDRERLRTYAVPPFNRISSLVNLTKLNFFSNDHQLLFSAHEPDSEVVARNASQLVIDAFARRTIVSGVERDGEELNIFVVWPVYSRGNLVGVIEAGGNVTPIVEDLGRTLYAKASIVDWSASPGNTLKVFASSNYAVHSLGTMEVDASIATVAADVGRGVSVVINSPAASGGDAEASVVPILSYAGQVVAALLVERDVTPLRQSMTSIAMQNMILSLIGVGGALLFVSIGIRRSLGRLNTLTAAIDSFAQGKSPNMTLEDAPDEVGVLGDALTRMMTIVTQTHEQLLESERRAHEASAAKSMFIANMSHELRTPLNAIIGYAELIRDELKGRGDVNGAVDADKVYRSAVSLLSIINDLLDVAKLDANRMQIESIPVSVAALVREVIIEIEGLAQRNGNTLENAVDVGDAAVLVDPARMKQVLVNVLKNAAKFTSNGKIALRVSRAQSPSRNIVFEVQDSGMGIAGEALPGLFSPFSQVDQSTARRHGGLGVGLAISKRLCELMRGTLEIASEVGAGTTVRITLPEFKQSREAA